MPEAPPTPPSVTAHGVKAPDVSFFNLLRKTLTNNYFLIFLLVIGKYDNMYLVHMADLPLQVFKLPPVHHT